MTPAGHRRLILTRHAKSSWDDPQMEDHARPLNKRGIRAALELGHWLHTRGYEPDEVLCSTALRSRETWTTAAAAPLEVTPEVKNLDRLYHASPDVMLAVLRHATGDCVMMVGHNPGIGEFAQRLVSRAPSRPEFHKYPTAATLVVDFEIADWSEAKAGAGSVLDFFVPAGDS